jgi:hypothetical protein
MQTYMFAAAVLIFIIGIIHSALGEFLIFRHLRNKSLVPAIEALPLRERHIRILWASWHLATVFGWAIGFVLLKIASPSVGQSLEVIVRNAAVCAFLGGSFLVLIGTKGRHPGWIAFLTAAALVWFS